MLSTDIQGSRDVERKGEGGEERRKEKRRGTNPPLIL